jgi:hypothetical protein
MEEQQLAFSFQIKKMKTEMFNNNSKSRRFYLSNFQPSVITKDFYVMIRNGIWRPGQTGCNLL